MDGIAQQLLSNFTRIASADGSRIELLGVEESRIVIGMRPGNAAPCEDGACVLPHTELQQMMTEWLSRRAPEARVVVRLVQY